MKARLRTHVRTNVVGYVALTIALIGVPTTWAVARNSVGSPQIRPKAVKTGDIANGAVTSKKVADGSLGDQDFTVSPDSGAPTSPVIVGRGQTNDDGGAATALCQDNEQLIAGGGSGVVRHGYRLSNRPVTRQGQAALNGEAPYGWVFGNSHGLGRVQAIAVCARFPQPAEGPPGPPGPPGEIADQQCPANQFVRGFTNGQIDCAFLEITPSRIESGPENASRGR